MYYLYDLKNDEVVSKAETREDLLKAWVKYACGIRGRVYTPVNRFQNPFLELSMTDYDTRCVLVNINSEYENNYHVLRRFRVYDSNWKIIDIREWPECNVPFSYKPIIIGYYRSWHKCSHKSCKGPSFHKRDLQSKHKDEDYSVIKPAKISSIDAWDYIEDKYFGSYCSSKSWKDQSKSRHQWEKHKSPEEFISLKAMYKEALDLELKENESEVA